MSDERIQIVNEHDQPVGTATKAEAWKRGLRHRIVRIVAQDKNGRILLQKRAATKHPFPGCWDSAASGHVDEGEDYLAAAHRELAEEIGVKNADLQEMGTYESHEIIEGRKLNRFTKTYRLLLDAAAPLTPQPSEVVGTQWFTLTELLELVGQHPDQVTDGLMQIVAHHYTFPPVVIVDEHDQPVGTAKLYEAWKQGLWYRTVQVMVEDGQGNVLLQKRAPTLELFPNCWEVSAAGHVDEGLTYKSAAKIEVSEELGVPAPRLEEFGHYSIQKKYPERIMNHYSKVYRMQLSHDTVFIPGEGEVSSLKWVSIAKVKAMVQERPGEVTDVLKEIIGRYY